MRTSSLFIAAIAATVAVTTTVADDLGTTYVVEARRIHTVSGAVLDHARILVVDGVIKAIGHAVEIPEGIRRVQAQVVVPALVDGYCTLAGEQIGKEPLGASRSALVDFDRHADYRVAVEGGVVTAYAAATGRLVAGQGAVGRLTGPAADRVWNARASLEIALGDAGLAPPGEFDPPARPGTTRPYRPAAPSYPLTRMGELALVRHLLSAASDATGASGQVPDADRAVWRSVIAGELPLFIKAETASDCLRALALADEFRVRVVLVGATGAHQVATEVARRGIPVIVRALGAGDRVQDRTDPRGVPEGRASYDAAATLARAGVSVAIAAGAPDRQDQLLFNASLAIRCGMDEAAALAAVTRVPALALGIADRTGHLAPGVSADLLLLSGEPFAAGTQIEQVHAAGRVAYARRDRPDAGITPPLPLAAEVIAIKAGTILTVGRGRVSPGVLLVARGKVLAIGGAGMPIPADAKVIDLGDRVIAPGMVDAYGHLGIARLHGLDLLDRSSPVVDLSRGGTPLHLAMDVDDPALAQALAQGVTAALVGPMPNQPLCGGGSLVKLAGKDKDKRLVAEHAALVISAASLAQQGTPRTGLHDALEQLMDRGKKYHDTWVAYEEKQKKGEPKKDDEPAKIEEVKKDDPISGTWSCTLYFNGRRFRQFNMELKLEGTSVTGVLSMRGQTQPLDSGEWDPAKKTLVLRIRSPMGVQEFRLELTSPDKLEGEIDTGGPKIRFEAERTSASGGSTTKRRASDKPRVERQLEPFRSLFAGKGAAIVHAQTADEITAALETIADKHAIARVAILASPACAAMARELARRGCAVVVVPQEEHAAGGEASYLPAILHRAGLDFAFGSGGHEGAALLPLAAAFAVARGLPEDEALRSLTATPARMLGQGGRLGSLEPGADADLVVWTAHPAAPSSRVERVMVDGEWVYDRAKEGSR